jgi:hypothetical protein
MEYQKRKKYKKIEIDQGIFHILINTSVASMEYNVIRENDVAERHREKTL